MRQEDSGAFGGDLDGYMEQSEPSEIELIAATRLTKDLKLSAKLMTTEQARYLVDLYYQLQKLRIGAAAQVRSAGEEPNQIISWTKEMYATLESDVKAALQFYAEGQVPGQWALSIKGIGPVIAAGLLAHISIEETPTAGALWRYAGYDPSVKWLGKEKTTALVKEVTQYKKLKQVVTDEQIVEIARHSGYRAEQLYKKAVDEDGDVTCASVIAMLSRRPWNARLKVLGWKAGQSFVKTSNRQGDVYGHLYRQRKLWEMERNQAYAYKEQAERALTEKRIGSDKEAFKWYTMGMLPPGHIEARAERWAVKIFLSHYHAVAYEHHHGKPAPRPYAITYLEHQDMIEVTNWRDGRVVVK